MSRSSTVKHNDRRTDGKTSTHRQGYKKKIFRLPKPTKNIAAYKKHLPQFHISTAVFNACTANNRSYVLCVNSCAIKTLTISVNLISLAMRITTFVWNADVCTEVRQQREVLISNEQNLFLLRQIKFLKFLTWIKSITAQNCMYLVEDF